ncbi:GerMN domain-containing protein [Plantactinospora sp. GCM10030261]|uniref:GerMN domain-containing protein n=1 Tax=Plantactinospora sp. GCM10030261 TaxID=3273420 RepID=UPI00360E3D7E
MSLAGRAAVIRGYAVVAVLVAALTACGVPTEDAPRAVQPPRGPVFASATATADPSASVGGVTEELCFVRDDQLVSVVRRIADPADADNHLRDLVAGPTAAERDRQLASALPGAIDATRIELAGGHAVVSVAEIGEGTGRSDAVLAFGQVVCTLTSRDDVSSVSFRLDGRPLGVPRADGSLTTQPLTAADYAILIAPR